MIIDQTSPPLCAVCIQLIDTPASHVVVRYTDNNGDIRETPYTTVKTIPRILQLIEEYGDKPHFHILGNGATMGIFANTSVRGTMLCIWHVGYYNMPAFLREN